MEPRPKSRKGKPTPLPVPRFVRRISAWLDCGPKLPGARIRKLPPSLALALWISQALNRNLSCLGVLALLGSRFGLGDVPSTSAFCQARSRLSERQIDNADRAVAARFAPSGPSILAGRPLKVVDGVSFTTMDTRENRNAFSCPAGQKPGCGFPVLSCMAVRLLDTGRMLALSFSKWSTHDLRLFFAGIGVFVRGDIVVADRAFDAFVVYASLLGRGVDAICRAKSRRRRFPPAGRCDCHADRLLTLQRPGRSDSLGAAGLAKLPETIRLRCIHAKIKARGFRDGDLWLMTTLLDKSAHPAGEILKAYAMRWGVEVSFRDVKTSMEGAFLRARSPEMAEKSIRVFFLAHNIVRLMLHESGMGHPGWELSFKNALPIASELLFALMDGEDSGKFIDGRGAAIARLLFRKRERPGQPRAVKRRAKPYPVLTVPRREYKEIPHRNHYRKGA